MKTTWRNRLHCGSFQSIQTKLRGWKASTEKSCGVSTRADALPEIRLMLGGKDGFGEVCTAGWSILSVVASKPSFVKSPHFRLTCGSIQNTAPFPGGLR